MNKEEFLKIRTCVLKVNIHCDGCKQKVKKILQKIDGVYTIKIDSDQGKVTVSGNIDAATLVRKLTKNGKHAEIWGASKANNNHQNQLNNQLKNLHIDNGKSGKNKGQGQKNGGNNQPKVGPQGQNPQIQQQFQQLQQQQLQQLQQLKGFPDMRMPINNKDQNQKSVKFSMPEEEDMTDDDDYDYDDDDDDYDDDDEMDDMPMHNKKPVMGNGHGGAQMTNIMMNNMMKGAGNAGNNGGNGAGNLNKGGSGGGNIPAQMNHGGANVGKKGGNGNNNGGNQNQGGAKGGKNGGGQPQDGKNGGGHNKNGNGGGGGGGGAGNGINFNANGAYNGGGMKDMHHGMMPNMMNVGQMGKNMPMPMGQMGHLPMGQMGNLSAVQGLPASAANGGGGGGAGYFPGGAAPEQMAGNPYYQQQLATMMMNQQRANGNERFHPMMYARPPPAVNYMPPYPPYPYPPPPGDRVDQYSMFSDENTSSCTVM